MDRTAWNSSWLRGVAARAAVVLVVGCSSGDDASVSFAEPTDGAEVTAPVAVRMQASGVEVEPADSGINEGAGHFHIMVDKPCIEEGEVIPNDDSHRHFGDGSTEAELELEPGEHTLCLQLGDGTHVATGLTDEITVTVTE